MTTPSAVQQGLFVVGRLLFGGVLVVLGLNSFRRLDENIGFAESKGVPLPSVLVPTSHVMLVFGGGSIVVWRWPVIGAGAVAAFFLGVTPQMHDFWKHEGDQREEEIVNFLMNSALLGAAIAFLYWGINQ